MTQPLQRAIAAALSVLGIGFVAVNLRPGAASIGPVLQELTGGLGMSAGLAGILTGLPGMCFGLVGAVAVALSRRLGLSGAVLAGLVLVLVGLTLRAQTDSVPTFLTLSVIALAGMAIGNVLVPAWIKEHGGSVQVILATLYGSGLLVGGILASLLTPIVGASHGWRTGLGLWGWTVLPALGIWAWFTWVFRSGDNARAAAIEPPSGRIAHSTTAVAMALAFGIQSMHAYIQFGWMPQILRDAGVSATTAGAMLSLLSAITLIGGIALPTVIARVQSLTAYTLSLGVALAAGYLGLLFAPATAPWLWAILLGYAGGAFPMVIALLTARTRHPSVTAKLSGFVQPIGYVLAGVGPVLVGVIHQTTGSWTLVLWLLIASAVPFTWASVTAARPVYVDDELAARVDRAAR